jgi:acyl-CoA reductase-like NAD-dependent aldehyde dehydrogenase
MEVMMVRVYLAYSVDLELELLQEETFGPVVGIQKVTPRFKDCTRRLTLVAGLV